MRRRVAPRPGLAAFTPRCLQTDRRRRGVEACDWRGASCAGGPSEAQAHAGSIAVERAAPAAAEGIAPL